MLVVAAPFVAESIPELCVKVVSDEPNPPSVFRPEIPMELERLVLPLRWRGGALWAYPLSVGEWGDVVTRAAGVPAPSASGARGW